MPFNSWSFLCLAISAKSFHWIGLKFVLNIQEILRTPSIMFPFKYLLLNGYSKQIINRKSLLPGWRICHFQKCKSPPVFTFLQPNLVLSSIDVVLTHLDVNWVCIKKTQILRRLLQSWKIQFLGYFDRRISQEIF